MGNWDTWVASHRYDSAAWAQVRGDEADLLWDRFDAAFRIRSSLYDVPGIDEPTPSITYDLTYEDGTRVEPVWVNRVVLAALRRVTGVDDSVVVLDWRHQGYRCRPHRIRDKEPPHETWPIEIHPDHDYYVWLAEDFRFGTFGHPWEPSLCVFGEELLAAVAEIGDEALGRILRRNGTPARVTERAESTDTET
ncbi:DUF2716 domain-containing protein [Actinospica durhamensis]|uniref:DUF2716 domain-containing protein n=1 Tax=Actinospica durhamensis TaxID=1508375 RepID=A0A941EZ19_9ACTN|nr:DUF2716 domain-containing protein [Actinospica durhamensis]MBR7839163.1 DUF2716 domain-containing protein [Actinospica durhamensis]